MANTRTITTVKQPYYTSDGTKLFLGTSTEVEVDNNGKYVPNSSTISLRLYTGGILGTDYVVVGTRKPGETWQLEKDGNGNYAAGLDLQKTLANRNSMLNINLNSHISRALGAPLQGVPAGQVNTNSQSSSNAALGLPTPGASPDPQLNGVPLEIDEIKSDIDKEDYEHLKYPIGIRDYGQDYITFSAVTYGTRSISPSANSNSFTPGIGNRTEETINGSVTLPIQPSITDTNTVQWGGEDLNAISAFAASVSYGAMGNTGQAVSDAISSAEDILKNNTNISPAVRLYLAGKAVGVNGLLSRIGGAVLNPNLELLFQGPQLRPFNFNFRLSPRDNDEATQVRKIIRYFKQNMSVKTTADNIFLKAPNVFDIKYVRGKSIDRNGKVINPIDPHPSLNKIKRCALVSCSVDYTPDGTYMTFADTNATMTSYSISLQFQELEPVTERDYKGLDKSTIGY